MAHTSPSARARRTRGTTEHPKTRALSLWDAAHRVLPNTSTSPDSSDLAAPSLRCQHHGAPSRAGLCHKEPETTPSSTHPPGPEPATTLARSQQPNEAITAHPAPRTLCWSPRPWGTALPISHQTTHCTDHGKGSAPTWHQHHVDTVPSAARELPAQYLSMKGTTTQHGEDKTNHGRAAHAPVPPHNRMVPVDPAPSLPAAHREPHHLFQAPRRTLPRPRPVEPRSSWMPQHP